MSSGPIFDISKTQAKPQQCHFNIKNSTMPRKDSERPLVGLDGNAKAHWPWMWIGAGGGLFITLILLLIFVAMTTNEIMVVISSKDDADLGFVFSGLALVSMTLLRLLAIFTGSAIAFAGLAVSFFAHDKETSIALSTRTEIPTLQSDQSNSSSFVATPNSTSLKTYSPGIIGVLTGAVIILYALFHSSEHVYHPPAIEVTYTQSNINKITSSDDDDEPPKKFINPEDFLTK